LKNSENPLREFAIFLSQVPNFLFKVANFLSVFCMLTAWDFIARSWYFLKWLGFFGVIFLEIRPWDFSWDIANQGKKGFLAIKKKLGLYHNITKIYSKNLDLVLQKYQGLCRRNRRLTLYLDPLIY
jgi:hypothetical protein